MSLHLGILYHWSPAKNRKAIARHGLRVGKKARMVEGFESGVVCLATTPSSAWGLIVDPDVGSWDLWQVQVREGDHLSIRGDFAPFVREVRTHHGLPSDRVWLVGTREV
jgi:hypothetical protein